MLPLFQLHISIDVVSCAIFGKGANDFQNQALTAAENMF
jgi:hypothetical protein